ncbi:G2/M phase-specific E3 ubiquitin-protein ligase-like [Homarus americanus]|uniref:G2/M phase-specific E3 ubiquitin-protein ligase-like n=1 Tax=Homarus americanus TaxID=6706 RepID=A0A8J5MN53_HOMAM|nr:G2/M phase-specific E3 ubiquitin-protein ligase-like [Homarus americanus]
MGKCIMNRRKSKGSKSKPYRPQDLIEACRYVKKGEMLLVDASRKFGVPRSTIWYNVYGRCKNGDSQPQVENLRESRTKSGEEIGCTMTSTSTKSKVLCCFCGIGNERELELGKLYTEENISVHYYCLLFSSALPQNGDDEEGIMGFLPKDLEKEIQRGRKLSCCYCFKRGATIGCSERKCRKTYHYPCGIEHHALFKFTNDFRSYCSQHRTFQKGKGAGEEVQCPICLEELIADPKTAVWAPCCKRNFWFHKLCLQRLALSAGYFFKCPLCNDKEQFAVAMQNVGIYIPENVFYRDASWELEPNAYSELLERPIHCDAPKCRCPDGRKIDNDGSRWEILLCNLCGSTGVHVACGGLSFSCVEWTCPVCASMVAESVKRTQQETREKRLKERKDKIRHSSGEDESTSYETALCMMSSSSESHSVKCGDGSTDVRDIHQTPCKRKLEVKDSIEETPSKFFSIDEGCVLKLTGNGDSDDEIDVESGECQVPPHTIIRELEEHGEELPKLLTKVKNSAVRAQERMSELRLTEIEIVKMAKEFSQYKTFPLDKSDIIRFYRYSLPFEKMLFVLKLIKVIFALREAAVEVHSSGKKQKKAKGSTPGRRSRRLNSPKTPNIKIPFLKNALKQTVIAARRSPRSVEKLEIKDHENSTEIDYGYLHAVKMKLYSSLDHENGASEKFKEDISIADLNSAAFCAVSPIQPSVAPQTVEKPGISESTDTHRRETGFKFSPEGEVGPAASSLSERLSTKDEKMTDQGIVDKENTYSSQKNNNDIKDQEANTVGACRKLSLVCAAHDGEPEDYDDPGKQAFASLILPDRYESVLTPKPLVSNPIINELMGSVAEKKSESEKCTTQNLTTAADESHNITSYEKLKKPFTLPFNSDKYQISESNKRKRTKSRSQDQKKYIQKTLSPFFLKNKILS